MTHNSDPRHLPVGTPTHPPRIVVVGQYKWFPLRAEGFGDFAPDDPAAALDLSDELVRDLYQWAKDIDAVMERWLDDRDDAASAAAYERLEGEGERLAGRLGRELGSGRSASYGGIH